MGVKEENEVALIIKVEEKKERVMAVKIEIGKEIWRIVRVYVKEDMKEKLEALEEWMEEQEKGK